LIGDATKAQAKLRWKPKYSTGDIVNDMVMADLKLFERHKILISNGQEVLNSDE